jgi:hypothetical protein
MTYALAIVQTVKMYAYMEAKLTKLNMDRLYLLIWARFQHEDCNTYGLHANLLGLNQYAYNHSQILSI